MIISLPDVSGWSQADYTQWMRNKLAEMPSPPFEFELSASRQRGCLNSIAINGAVQDLVDSGHICRNYGWDDHGVERRFRLTYKSRYGNR